MRTAGKTLWGGGGGGYPRLGHRRVKSFSIQRSVIALDSILESLSSFTFYLNGY